MSVDCVIWPYNDCQCIRGSIIVATKKITPKIQPKKSTTIQKKTTAVVVKKVAKKPGASLTTIAKQKTETKTKNSAVITPTTKKPPAKRIRSQAKHPDDLLRAPMVELTIPLMREICGRVASGEALYKICGTPGFPSRTEFFRRCGGEKEYAEIYNAALALRGEQYADELTERADEARGKSGEDIQAIKLEVNTRQWVVSRLLPKKYGDRMTVSGDAENPLVTQLVLGANDLMSKIKGGKK